MPHYKLVSSHGDIVAQIDGTNAACALALASGEEVQELHVFQDGTYLFTLNGGQENCWTVQTKPASELPTLSDLEEDAFLQVDSSRIS